METPTEHNPAERWIHRLTGEITALLGERDPAEWVHVTFKRDDPDERQTVESYLCLEPGEKAPTTWTAYFDGKPSHWVMQEYRENADCVLPGCKYGFIIYREEPQYADLDACASGFALVAGIESEFIEAKYQLDRDQRPYALPNTQVTRPTKKPTSVQDYITQALAGAIEDQRTKATVSYQFSNRGTMYAMRGFTTVASVKFDFQDTYCTLKLKGADDNDIQEHHYLKYTEGEKIEAFITRVTAICRRDAESPG